MGGLHFDVSWSLALSEDTRGGVVAHISREFTLGRFASLLKLGSVALLRVREGKTDSWTQHSSLPFLDVGEDEPVHVGIVVLADGWPHPSDALQWDDVPSIGNGSPTSLLQSLATTQLLQLFAMPDSASKDGVLTRARVEACSTYLVDDRYVFAQLVRTYDVWMAYWGDLVVNGFSVQPRSVWLHGDLHTPLQPVEVGQDFTLPIVAAQYTAMHLRFELEPSQLTEGPFRISFNASFGMVHSKRRRELASTDHVSWGGGWALSQGEVAWFSSDPSFLEARVTCFEGIFVVPAQCSHEYALASEDDADFEGDTGDAGDAPWHKATDPYRELAVRRRSDLTRPWGFTLRARPCRVFTAER